MVYPASAPTDSPVHPRGRNLIGRANHSTRRDHRPCGSATSICDLQNVFPEPCASFNDSFFSEARAHVGTNCVPSCSTSLNRSFRSDCNINRRASAVESAAALAVMSNCRVRASQAAHYSFRIDVPGDADEVEHRGRPDLVTAVARGRGAQDLVPGFGAAVNIGEIKPRKRRGWLSE